ncbi:MAG: hypothetical protein N2491_01655 [Negativicutes bacterium]|nr:hypothetical protein [Negativicutes bacterium]
MFKTTTPLNDDTGAAIVAQLFANDEACKLIDDSAPIASGVSRGKVVKWNTANNRWELCNGTVALGSTDVIGICEYANGTLGQVRIAGVFTDDTIAANTLYYCQSNGTIGTTPTKVFIGRATSAKRLCMPAGAGLAPATTTTLGGVIIGAGITVDANGIISADAFNVPPRWKYLGDGCEGPFNSTGNLTLGGEHFYTDFTLNAGHTLTVDPNIGCLIIRATGTVTIAGSIVGRVNNGISYATDINNSITLYYSKKKAMHGYGCGCGGRGNGRTSSTNPGLTMLPGPSVIASPHSYASFMYCYDGRLGTTNSATVSSLGHSLFLDPGYTREIGYEPPIPTPQINYMNLPVLATTGSLSASAIRRALMESPIFYGSAGGCGYNDVQGNPTAGKGGDGGAGVLIAAKTIIFTGSIDCSGQQGGAPGHVTYTGGGGGGGGGCIAFFASNITDTGTKNVSGGAASTGSYPGEAGSPGWTLNAII